MKAGEDRRGEQSRYDACGEQGRQAVPAGDVDQQAGYQDAGRQLRGPRAERQRREQRAGGYGRAVFTDAAGSALAVPETAVRYDANGASVMVLQPNNRVRQVAVRTGMRGSGLVQLTDGPPVGSKVVANAASFLLYGDLVRPVEGAVQTAAAGR